RQRRGNQLGNRTRSKAVQSKTAQAVPQKAEVLLLTRRDVAALLTMEECIVAVEAAFRAYGEGTTQPPSALGTHVPGGGFHVKAGVLPFEGRLYYAAKA